MKGKNKKKWIEDIKKQKMKTKKINNRTVPIVQKEWGKEIWIHNDSDYCGKLLKFNGKGDKFSMHYHMIKNESWWIEEGEFSYYWIDLVEGKVYKETLREGDVVWVKRGDPHQLECVSEGGGVVFEVSTEHFDEDSYRISKELPKEWIEIN